MKLDKIKLAMLIGFVSCRYAITLTQDDIAEIDQIIDIELPAQSPLMASTNDINMMLQYMSKDNKIEAIRLHRQMTGMGLKESKDMIELVTSRFVS